MHIEPGLQCLDLDDFLTLLRSWLSEADEETFGDRRGQSGVVRVPIAGVACSLSGDTTRSGVAAFLRSFEEQGTLTALAERGGTGNRVAVGSPPVALSGFDLSTDHRVEAPLELVGACTGDSAQRGRVLDRDVDGLLADVLRTGAVAVLPEFLDHDWEAPVAVVRALLESGTPSFTVEVARGERRAVHVVLTRDDADLHLDVVGDEQEAASDHPGWSRQDGHVRRTVPVDSDAQALATQLVDLVRGHYGVDLDDEWSVTPVGRAGVVEAAMTLHAGETPEVDPDAGGRPRASAGATARLMLEMVAVLHRRGYQLLRICPGASGSGVYRCAIALREEFVGSHHTELTGTGEEADRLLRWTSAAGPTPYLLDVRDDSTPEQLADTFLALHPELCRGAHGQDGAYAGWFQEMLTMSRGLDALPLFYADFHVPEDGRVSFGPDAAPWLEPPPYPDLDLEEPLLPTAR